MRRRSAEQLNTSYLLILARMTTNANAEGMVVSGQTKATLLETDNQRCYSKNDLEAET